MKDDNWTDHVEPGDWVVDTTYGYDQRMKFLRIEDDYVRFERASGSESITKAYDWQDRWRRGNLQKEITVDDSAI